MRIFLSYSVLNNKVFFFFPEIKQMLPSALLPVWQPSRRSASGEPKATGVSQSQGHLERPPASLCSLIRGAGPFCSWVQSCRIQILFRSVEPRFRRCPHPRDSRDSGHSDGSKRQAECRLDSETKEAVPCF